MSNHAIRRGKQYRPRPVNRLGGLAVIDRKHAQAEDARPIPAGDRTDLQCAYWLAFNAMTSGASSEENWSIVVVSLNIALILTERGIGHEYEPYIVKALDGAFRAKVRAGHAGVWRYDGEAITAIREALEVHDEQVRITSKEEMRAALTEVYARINGGHVYQSAPAHQPAAPN